MSELYALPDGWEWKKLGDIGKITTGNTPSKKESKYWKNGEYLFVKPPHLGNNKAVDNTEEKLTIAGFEKSKPIAKNSIMVCCIGSLGKIGIADRQLCTNQQINSITFHENIVDFKYGYYFATTLEKKMNRMANKAVVAIINKSTFSTIELPLPALQEQKRIVAKLDALFAKIDQASTMHQQNIDEADKFMGSVLNEVFGELEKKYEKQTLVFFDNKMSAGGTPLRKEKDYWNGDIEWFSSGELNQLYTLPANEKITQIGLKKSSAKLFKKGTLLIGMYDTAAMKMSILSNDGSCNQAIVGFNPKEDELNIFFVKYQLEYLKENILEQRQGVRQKNLNLSKLKNIEIEFPPLKIQQKTVTYLDQLSQKTEILKQIQKEKLENLKALKASILDKAFRGEL